MSRVKQLLAMGKTPLGTMIMEFNSTGVGRIAAEAGADFVIFDQEHTGWSVETIRMLVATSRSANLGAFVRVPATQYHLIARVLDVGAQGLMIPMVESEEQARLVVQSAKYPPQGRRGAGFGLAHDDYRDGDIMEKMRSANEDGLIIAQIETRSGVENVDRIAAVEGVDVLWIGHFDLTNSLGIPGQFDHPEYLRSVDAVLEACHRHRKAAGMMVQSVEQGRELLAQGFRILAYWGDAWLFKKVLREGLSAIRQES